MGEDIIAFTLSCFYALLGIIILISSLYFITKEYTKNSIKFNLNIVLLSCAGIFISIFLILGTYIVKNKIEKYNKELKELNISKSKKVEGAEFKDVSYEESIPEIDYQGTIGDLFGGIYGPIIGMLGAIFGGMAFYAQFKANKQVQDQFKLQQFENHFYEMLRIHKDNVNNMKIDGYKFISKKTFFSSSSEKIEYQISGVKTFVTLIAEFESVFTIVKKVIKENISLIDPEKRNTQEKLNQFIMDNAFFIFFNGLLFYKKNLNRLSKLDSTGKSHFIDIELGNKIINVLTIYRDYHYNDGKKKFKNFDGQNTLDMSFNFKPFSGHIAILSHYFRHIFQICKYVVKQDEDFLSYEQKREYLRTLRSNISTYEQLLIYYNWLGFGVKWEEKLEEYHKDKYYHTNNKFFTDYRMIHNIPNTLVLKEFKLDKYFDEKYTDKMKFEDGRKDDYLFDDIVL